MNTNWMNVNGSNTRIRAEPLSSTTTENSCPIPEVNTTSPYPSVLMVTMVQ